MGRKMELCPALLKTSFGQAQSAVLNEPSKKKVKRGNTLLLSPNRKPTHSWAGVSRLFVPTSECLKTPVFISFPSFSFAGRPRSSLSPVLPFCLQHLHFYALHLRYMRILQPELVAQDQSADIFFDEYERIINRN
jgi:hypothetical protein